MAVVHVENRGIHVVFDENVLHNAGSPTGQHLRLVKRWVCFSDPFCLKSGDALAVTFLVAMNC